VAGCDDPVRPDDDAPSQFITARRAWLPGERDSLIARIMASRSLTFPYVGDISDLADVLVPPDSAVVFVPNPLYTPTVRSAMQFRIQVPTDNTWSGSGLFLKIFNDAITPRDTINWTGGIWYKIGEETWHGVIFAAQSDSVFGPVSVRTNTFDAGGGKSGAGAGEARQSTGEYWEADGSGNPHTIEMTAASFGAASTVASGVWMGGSRRTGTMRGRVRQVRMPRELPTDDGSFITLDIDFRVVGIPAVAITCLFPVPCIGDTTAMIAARRTLRTR
jgi:hypothetical protein